jgi:hypothetical protein
MTALPCTTRRTRRWKERYGPLERWETACVSNLRVSRTSFKYFRAGTTRAGGTVHAVGYGTGTGTDTDMGIYTMHKTGAGTAG